MKKPKKFIAEPSSINTNIPVKQNDQKFIAETFHVKKHNIASIDYDRGVDLDKLGVHSLVNELISKYNQDNDVGIIRSWFRRKRVEAQDKNLTAISNLVRNIRMQAHDLVGFKAELISQQEVLNNKIIEIIQASEFELVRQREQHETFLASQEDQREASRLELDRLRYENERLKYEAEEQKGKAEDAKQKARIRQLRGDLIEKITKDVNFSDINMKQVFVIIEMVKDSTTEADIITAEARWEQMKAEAKKTEAEAQSKGYEAEQKGYKTKKMKTELEKVGVKLNE